MLNHPSRYSALEAEDAKLTATHDHRSKQFRLLMHLVRQSLMWVL